MDLNALHELQKSSRVLQFLGSGVSIDLPSGLPSAQTIVDAFLHPHFGAIPGGLDMASKLSQRRPLPEFVYGTFERNFDERVYDVWRCLDLWSPLRGLGPNAGHLAAVDIAHRSGTPILTPNFDGLFEEAATRLGLIPRVTVARPDGPFVPEVAGAREVAIWKLHGTSKDPTSVFSSVRTLATAKADVRAALGAQLRQPDIQLILAGYSGRDLDLFPIIAENPATKAPIWLDITFGETHLSNEISAQQVTGSFTELGALWLRDSSNASAHRALTTTNREARSHIARRSKALLDEQVQRHIEVVSNSVSGDAVATAIAEVLINSGLSGLAIDMLERARPTGEIGIERDRLLSKAHLEQGHLISAIDTAKAGLRRRPGYAGRATLWFSIAIARITLEATRLDFVTVRAKAIRMTLTLAPWTWLLVRFASVLSKRFRTTAAEPLRTPAIEGYLEHMIRGLLGLQRTFLGRYPVDRRRRRYRLERIFTVAWRWLEERCARRQYAEGMANCARYRERLTERASSKGSMSEAVHGFLGHSLGTAIAARDHAVALARGGHMKEAHVEFLRATDRAREQRDPLLWMSTVRAAHEAGFDIPTVGGRGLVSSIEAPWKDQALAWLDGLDSVGK